MIVLKNLNTTSGYTNENTNILSEFLRIYAVSSEHKGPADNAAGLRPGRCHYGAVMNADWLPDETPVRSLCQRMVCTRCGMIGADVRSDWGPHLNKRHV